MANETRISGKYVAPGGMSPVAKTVNDGGRVYDIEPYAKTMPLTDAELMVSKQDRMEKISELKMLLETLGAGRGTPLGNPKLTPNKDYVAGSPRWDKEVLGNYNDIMAQLQALIGSSVPTERTYTKSWLESDGRGRGIRKYA